MAKECSAGVGGGRPSGAAVQGEVKHEKCVQDKLWQL